MPRPFDSYAYLKRLRLEGSVAPNESGLETLHRAQAHEIPFENFDILLGRGIHLHPNTLFEKLVKRNRGGYCFELNGLFLRALHHFGFEARPLLARVHIRGTITGRGHQLNLVTLGKRQWLADVGFGSNGLVAPIPFELNHPFQQDHLTFRILSDELYGYMLQIDEGGKWTNLYSFELSHVTDADIAMGNHFTSTHPESTFTRHRVVTMPTALGRKSIFDHTYTVKGPQGESHTNLSSGPSYLEALKDHFGIELDAEEDKISPLFG